MSGPEIPTDDEGLVRLQKLLAQSGVASAASEIVSWKCAPAAMRFIRS